MGFGKMVLTQPSGGTIGASLVGLGLWDVLAILTLSVRWVVSGNDLVQGIVLKARIIFRMET
jgi:hypothetical protein